ncbi:MAG: cyclic nucleotide-binding domain-containing protein [Bacteroidota bacterium]
MHEKNFRKFIERFTNIDNKSFKDILIHFQLTTFKKGEFFAKESTYNNRLGFLSQGIARSYYFNSDGDEITRRIATEPSMITVYDSFINEIPARESIEFIEDSHVYVITREKDLELIEKNRVYSNWRRIGIDHEFISVLRYLESFIDANAKDRYNMILKMNPKIIQRVPLQYIASMIGVTPTQLSRIRKS